MHNLIYTFWDELLKLLHYNGFNDLPQLLCY